MRVMAVGAEEISSLPGTRKIPCPFPVNACLPSFINVAMAFTTESVAFRKVDELTIVKSQFITISCIVTVKAPTHRLCMMQLNIGMFLF